MRKLTFYCDKCGKQIKEDLIEMQAGQLDPETEIWDRMPAIRLHFHLECMDGLIKDLSEKKKIAPVQKEKKTKKVVNRGTVKALYEADWPIKDIANDPKVQCSEWTVRHIIKELQEAGEL